MADRGAGLGFLEHLIAFPLLAQSHGLDMEMRLLCRIVNANQHFIFLQPESRDFGQGRSCSELLPLMT